MSSFRAWLANAEAGDLIYEDQVVGYEAVAIAKKNDWEPSQEDNAMVTGSQGNMILQRTTSALFTVLPAELRIAKKNADEVFAMNIFDFWELLQQQSAHWYFCL